MNFKNLPLDESRKKSRAKFQRSNNKPGRGWIAVNVSKGDVLEMKKLARASGWEFRHFCSMALHTAKRQLRQELGLSYRQAANLTGAQIRALAERSHLLRRVDMSRMPEKN